MLLRYKSVMDEYVIINQCSEQKNLDLLSGPASETQPSSGIDYLCETLRLYSIIVGQEHGGCCQVRVASNPQDRLPGEYAIHLDDATPEAPDAVAYHMTVNGVPDIVIGMDNIDNLATGSDSLTCAASHELGEAMGDPGANQYEEIPVPDNVNVRKARPKELCDRVQNLTFRLPNGADVSDFLLRSAFIPGAPAPWCYTALTTGQPVMFDQNDASNGYDNEVELSNEAQIPGMLKPRRVISANLSNLSEKAYKRKMGCFSRMRRRGANVVTTRA